MNSSNNPLGVRKGIWSPEEDILLRKCIETFGEGKWHLVPLRAGLNRCRKSCRLRWLNYLKPNIKRGVFTKDEVDLIIRLHKLLGNRWSLIAGRLPGRTANDVKNLWNSHIEKKVAAETLTGRVGAPKHITRTRSNIIRPRPQTFSDLARWSQLEAPNTNTNTRDVDDLPEGDDECRKWWSDLLKMATDSDDTQQLQLVEGDPQANVNKQGEGDGDGDDVGLTLTDVDIWKLLSFGEGEGE